MTLTFELYLDEVTVNECAKCLGKGL